MGISEELYILLSAVWLGCVVGAVHEVLCTIREIVKHREWIVNLEDFFYWIFVSVYVFESIFLVNNGNWRGYICIGVVVGVWSIHTIWYVLKKVFLKVRKTLKNKGKHRMIRDK